MDRKYVVVLSDAEREQLEKLVAAGSERARNVDARTDPAEDGQQCCGCEMDICANL